MMCVVRPHLFAWVSPDGELHHTGWGMHCAWANKHLGVYDFLHDHLGAVTLSEGGWCQISIDKMTRYAQFDIGDRGTSGAALRTCLEWASLASEAGYDVAVDGIPCLTETDWRRAILSA